MDIELFLLCDAATDTAGKLNILGAFDSIVVESTPAIHPQCAIALRVRFARGEEGQHQLNIHIVDADGQPIVPPLDAAINVAFQGDQTSVAANMIMNLQRLQLKNAGEYSIDVAVDGQHEKCVPLTVHVRPQQA